MIEMTLTEPQYWRPIPWSTTKVRITNDARRCVVFLGDCDPSGDPSTFEPRATAFLHWAGIHLSCAYLVTVKHFADGLPFWVRMNTKHGAIALLVEEPDWAFHDDTNVDIAIMEFTPPPEAVWTAWHGGSTQRLTERYSYWFGPGDLIYTVGLFTYHRGKSRNIPLVHAGHIAAFSEDEKIEVRDWDETPGSSGTKLIDAYVVQCAAMPGASGSPVFIRSGLDVVGDGHTHDGHGKVRPAHGLLGGVKPKAYGRVHLLGVWQGSWELPPQHQSNMRLPTGYGIVVPSEKIAEIINMPKLGDRRAAAKKAADEVKRKANPLPVPDSIPRKGDKALFDQTLKKMLDTPPAPHTKKPA